MLRSFAFRIIIATLMYGSLSPTEAVTYEITAYANNISEKALENLVEIASTVMAIFQELNPCYSVFDVGDSNSRKLRVSASEVNVGFERDLALQQCPSDCEFFKSSSTALVCNRQTI